MDTYNNKDRKCYTLLGDTHVPGTIGTLQAPGAISFSQLSWGGDHSPHFKNTITKAKIS